MIRVTTLAAGRCYNLAALAERGEPWRVRAYPAGFAVLQGDPSGVLLVDTGYGDAALRAFRRWPGLLYAAVTPVRLRPGERAVEQLAARGIAAGDVTGIVLTHLHADHIGALADFPRARCYYDADGAARVIGRRGLAALWRGFLPELLGDGFVGRAVGLRFGPPPTWLAAFGRAADVTGSGQVWAVPLPGHAAGEIAVCVGKPGDEDGTGLTFLAGDAAWSTRALRRDAHPHPLATMIFDNPGRARASAALVRRWWDEHPGAELHCSHDPQEQPCG